MSALVLLATAGLAFGFGFWTGGRWFKRQLLQGSYIVCTYCHDEAKWIAKDGPFVACDTHRELTDLERLGDAAPVEWERLW